MIREPGHPILGEIDKEKPIVRMLIRLALAFLVSAPIAGGQDRRGFAAQRLNLIIEGENCGWIHSMEGGAVIGAVVVEKPQGARAPKKHLGNPQVEDLRIELPLPLPRRVHDWVAAALAGNPARKSGSIVFFDLNNKSAEALEFHQAAIRSVTIPACDAASKEPENFVLTIAPSSVTTVPAANVDAAPARPKKTGSSFQVNIDGLTCTAVSSVEAITIKFPGGPASVGEMREPEKSPSSPEIPNLKIALGEANSQTWKQWLDDFVVKGNCGDDKEKGGAIEFIGANRKDVLFRVKLSGLGIVRCARDSGEGDLVRRLKAELYCESIELDSSGNPTPAPDPAAPKEEPKAPAESKGSEKDEGDRDPEGVPRYENAVRTSFQASRGKILDEQWATYLTKDAPKRVEEFFQSKLKEAGWEEEARSEGGDLKKGTNRVDLTYKKTSHTVTLVIGPTKEGTTGISVCAVDDYRLHKPPSDK